MALHAPVAHDTSGWSHEKAIEELAKEAGHPESIENVRVLICDHRGRTKQDIRRPFRNTFQTANAQGRNRRTVRIKGIKSLPILGAPTSMFWGWLAEHDREGALADVPYAGLRIRMHNIAVGDHTIIAKMFPTEWIALWCFGEIHITDLSLIPNSQRDEFEDSPEWDEVRKRLGQEARALERAIRKESEQRNQSVAGLEKSTRDLIEQAKDGLTWQFNSHEEKQSILDKLDKRSERLEAEAAKRKRTESEKEQLRTLREEVEQTKAEVRKVRRTGTDDATAHLNRQARKVLQAVYKVLKKELPAKQFNEIQEKVHAALKPGKGTKG